MFDFLAIAIYITSWWIIFGMLIPIGATPEEKPEEGHAVSAPKKSYLKQKAIASSIIALPVTYLLVSFY